MQHGFAKSQPLKPNSHPLFVFKSDTGGTRANQGPWSTRQIKRTDALLDNLIKHALARVTAKYPASNRAIGGAMNRANIGTRIGPCQFLRSLRSTSMVDPGGYKLVGSFVAKLWIVARDFPVRSQVHVDIDTSPRAWLTSESLRISMSGYCLLTWSRKVWASGSAER